MITGTDGIINGTMAIMVTDLDLFVTPFNTSMLNPHIIALGVSTCYSLCRDAHTNDCADVHGWIKLPLHKSILTAGCGRRFYDFVKRTRMNRCLRISLYTV